MFLDVSLGTYPVAGVLHTGKLSTTPGSLPAAIGEFRRGKGTLTALPLGVRSRVTQCLWHAWVKHIPSIGTPRGDAAARDKSRGFPYNTTLYIPGMVPVFIPERH